MSEMPPELKAEADAITAQYDFKDEFGHYPSPEELDDYFTEESSGKSLFGKGDWEPYEGPRGGSGWRNTDTGEVVYSEDPPGKGSSGGGGIIDGAVSEQSLSEKLGKKTFGTANKMDVLEMEDGSEVYKVTVDNEMMEEARDRTMTAYNFLEELGGSTATYDVADDGSWFASKEAEGESLRTVSDEVRDKINPDDVEWVMAEQLIAGNWDAHPDNIRVSDSGSLTVFDYDNASSDMTMSENISAFWETFSYIEGMVDDELDRDAIRDKAAEIATQVSMRMVDNVDDAKGSNDEMLENINNNLLAAVERDL